MSLTWGTHQEILILKQNPYVSYVAARIIRFTSEFKERFFEEYELGKSPAAIITGMGIDTKMLGSSRISGIRFHVLEQAKRPERFEHKLANMPRSISGNRTTTTNYKIAQLEHELAYTRQELDFLKKIILTDREMQRAWESKQRRKPSSK